MKNRIRGERMNEKLNEIIEDASNLPVVPSHAAKAYLDNTPLLKKKVDNHLTEHPQINQLIGSNPLQVMYDNHSNHAAFMATIFSITNYELLAKTIPWVYKTYSSHGFSHDYFPEVLNAWIQSLSQENDNELYKEIIEIYQWLLKKHEDMILASEEEKLAAIATEQSMIGSKNEFQQALLEGDHRKCLSMANENITTGSDVEKFYLHTIQPALYEIGNLWESGQISIAQEHLASAIVSRVMATTSMIDVPASSEAGKAIVTAGPNEFHETGAWMISDALERMGWKVRYLGANTPAEDLLDMMHEFSPDIIAVSVTMPFNILKAKEMIEAIRGDERLKSVHILIGGRAFNDVRDLWKTTGADAFAANLITLKQHVKSWGVHG